VTGIAARIADLQPDVIIIALENPNRDMLENMSQLSRAVKRPIDLTARKGALTRAGSE
jgi:response regulator NasT